MKGERITTEKRLDRKNDGWRSSQIHESLPVQSLDHGFLRWEPRPRGIDGEPGNVHHISPERSIPGRG